MIKEFPKLSFNEFYKKSSEEFGLLEEQVVKYLLEERLLDGRFILTNGFYYANNIKTKETLINVEKDEWSEIKSVKDVKEDSFTQIKLRRGQPKFRKNLLAKFNNTCVITGCDIVEILEAAHIIPYSISKNNDIMNGLILRTDIHTLYDLNLIAINPDNFKVQISDLLKDSKIYKSLEGLCVKDKLLGDINIKGLKERFTDFEEKS